MLTEYVLWLKTSDLEPFAEIERFFVRARAERTAKTESRKLYANATTMLEWKEDDGTTHRKYFRMGRVLQTGMRR